MLLYYPVTVSSIRDSCSLRANDNTNSRYLPMVIKWKPIHPHVQLISLTSSVLIMDIIISLIFLKVRHSVTFNSLKMFFVVSASAAVDCCQRPADDTILGKLCNSVALSSPWFLLRIITTSSSGISRALLFLFLFCNIKAVRLTRSRVWNTRDLRLLPAPPPPPSHQHTLDGILQCSPQSEVAGFHFTVTWKTVQLRVKVR